jgi:hypothetical protein
MSIEFFGFAKNNFVTSIADLALKAPLASPTFTGTVIATTIGLITSLTGKDTGGTYRNLLQLGGDNNLYIGWSAGAGIVLQTDNASGAGNLTSRLTLSGGVATAVLTLSNVTVTGFSLGTATAAFGSGAISYTGTLALTGSRVTQSYHTNITSTNAVTVDSSLLSKVPESIHEYKRDALSIISEMKVVDYRHYDYLDSSNRQKLGVIAESIGEPLALSDVENPKGGHYPGINLMGLIALQTKAIQQLDELRTELMERLERVEQKLLSAT